MVYLLKMVIFHSYVSLPEGNSLYDSYGSCALLICQDAVELQTDRNFWSQRPSSAA